MSHVRASSLSEHVLSACVVVGAIVTKKRQLLAYTLMDEMARCLILTHFCGMLQNCGDASCSQSSWAAPAHVCATHIRFKKPISARPATTGASCRRCGSRSTASLKPDKWRR
eukprot:2972261-Prymnesium_polylepis.1